MVLKPNIRWCSTTRTRCSASGAQPQYRWCSEDRILRHPKLPNTQADLAIAQRLVAVEIAKSHSVSGRKIKVNMKQG